MAAPAAVCDQAIKVQDAMIICAPVPAQIGVEAAIRQVWEYPETFKEELMSRRNVLAASIDQIPQLSWTQTEGGFFAFVRVEDCTDSASLARDLLDRAHVVTIPGSTFGRCGEGYIRLSYSAVSADELRSAMARIQRFFRE
jgi:aspartate/methionine/tyrosine aminotransferase